MPVYSSCATHGLSSESPAALNLSAKSPKHTNAALLHTLPTHIQPYSLTYTQTHRYLSQLYKTCWVSFQAKDERTPDQRVHITL